MHCICCDLCDFIADETDFLIEYCGGHFMSNVGKKLLLPWQLTYWPKKSTVVLFFPMSFPIWLFGDMVQKTTFWNQMFSQNVNLLITAQLTPKSNCVILTSQCIKLSLDDGCHFSGAETTYPSGAPNSPSVKLCLCRNCETFKINDFSTSWNEDIQTYD